MNNVLLDRHGRLWVNIGTGKPCYIGYCCSCWLEGNTCSIPNPCERQARPCTKESYEETTAQEELPVVAESTG
jgi:hypothetical protein